MSDTNMSARIEAAVAEATQAVAVERSAFVHREEAQKVWVLAQAYSVAAMAHLQALIDEAQADINARNVSPIFAAAYDVMFERLRAVGK